MRDLSRRRFLAGMGKMLLIPYLPSIHLPAFAAANDVKRFIAFKTNHGVVPGVWDSNKPTLSPLGDGVTSSANLRDVNGAVNAVLDTPELIALRDKINVVNGLDNITRGVGHAGGYGSVLGVDGSPQNSIDQILARSAAVYGDKVPARRSVAVTTCMSNTGDSGLARSYMSYSNGSLVNPIQQPYDLYQIMFANLVTDSGGGGGTPTVDPRVKIVDQVLEDYQNLRSHRNLSTTDRQKLDQHIDVLNDLENKFRSISSGGGVSPACNKPSAPPNSLGKTAEAQKLDLFLDIIYYMLKCDLTRVVTIPLSDAKEIIGIKQYHTSPEGAHGRTVAGVTQHHSVYANKIGKFLSRLENTAEGTGSMLDNSFVYWGHELGNMHFDGSASHYFLQQSVFTAGGLGGAFNTGKYIEYKRAIGGRSYGLPVNNMMESIMQGFGVAPSEYETSAGSGFGGYVLSNDKHRARLQEGYGNFNIVRNRMLPVLT